MLLKRVVVLRVAAAPGPCSGLNMHPKLGYLPNPSLGKKPAKYPEHPMERFHPSDILHAAR